METNRKAVMERDVRLYGCINEFASGYGSFCTECKSRRINDTCFNCLKMFREKVKGKCDEVRQVRNCRWSCDVRAKTVDWSAQ